jgi:HemX protein
MLPLIQILEVLLPIFYGGTFALYFREFLQGRDAQRVLGPRALYATVGLHGLYLVMISVAFHHFPISSRAEFLSVTALCVGLLYAFLETRNKESQTGVFFVSIAFIFQLIASILIEHTTTHPLLHENPVYGIHVIFMVFGFAALAISALYALMYIMLARQLKSRHLGVIFQRLPPLNTLENMSKLATISGIILLGIGLGTGHFVALWVLEDFNLLDPKIIVTDIVWLAYVIGFVVARWRGLSGLRMAYLNLTGYLGLIVAMLVVNTFLNTFHSFA